MGVTAILKDQLLAEWTKTPFLFSEEENENGRKYDAKQLTFITLNSQKYINELSKLEKNNFLSNEFPFFNNSNLGFRIVLSRLTSPYEIYDQMK